MNATPSTSTLPAAVNSPRPGEESLPMTKEAVFSRFRIVWALERALRRLRGTPFSSATPDTLGDRVFSCLLSFRLDYRASDSRRESLMTLGRELVAEFDKMEATPGSPVYLSHAQPTQFD